MVLGPKTSGGLFKEYWGRHSTELCTNLTGTQFLGKYLLRKCAQIETCACMTGTTCAREKCAWVTGTPFPEHAAIHNVYEILFLFDWHILLSVPNYLARIINGTSIWDFAWWS